jgi:virginiamycin B lyase
LSVTINEFPVPTASSGPFQIAVGPDGNLWFTENRGNKIGEINPTTHAILEFPIPTANSGPDGITAGPDGNLWFTEDANKIGQINPTTHAIAEFPIPTAYSLPLVITGGPDGNLWFTEQDANQIGQINPTTHAIAEFPVPTARSTILGITAGPDGNLWFTERSASQIGQINPTTHAIAEFPTSMASSDPLAITSGPDGNLWFTESNSQKIGEINPISHTSTDFPLPTGATFPFWITAGPDGNLWFTESNEQLSQIGQINPVSHAIAEFTIPTASSAPGGITNGPDGNLWFPEGAFNANKIGQVVLAARVTAPDLALSGTAPASVTLGSNLSDSLTVTNNGTAGATGVTLTDTLSAGVKFVSATGGITPVNGVVTFSLGSLAPGASMSVTIVVTPTAAGALSDTATVGMDQTDPTPANNSVTLPTTVTPNHSSAAPDLALSADAPGFATAGSNVTYSLTVTNGGAAGATGVTLTDTLPMGVKFVSATGGVQPVNGVLTFVIGNLASGAKASFSIAVTPTAAGSLTDRARVSLNQIDATPGDNSITLTTTIASVQRMGIHDQPTRLELRFGAPVDPAWAQSTANYHLVRLGGSHSTIRFESAVYDAATRTVTLRPVHRLNLHDLFRLTVLGPGTSGQTDPSGHLPNTTADGGNSFMAIISAADLVLTSKNPVILRQYHEILLDQSAQLKRL